MPLGDTDLIYCMLAVWFRSLLSCGKLPGFTRCGGSWGQSGFEKPIWFVCAIKRKLTAVVLYFGSAFQSKYRVESSFKVRTVAWSSEHAKDFSSSALSYTEQTPQVNSPSPSHDGLSEFSQWFGGTYRYASIITILCYIGPGAALL